MTSDKRGTTPVTVGPPCEVVDYERGWEAGRAAALEVLMNLRSKAVLRTTSWVVLNDAVHLVSDLQQPKEEGT